MSSLTICLTIKGSSVQHRQPLRLPLRPANETPLPESILPEKGITYQASSAIFLVHV
jgi:hypothetical protein